ncbi:MAG TPA: hypothetical protein VFH77_10640 [Streptomyces sp.]|nr:hypothetical protein [Streptomyces sp.]
MHDRPYDDAELRRLIAEGGGRDADPRELAALADLFGAATASRPAEPLPGEEAAVAAFRAAHTAAPAARPAATTRRRRFSRRTTALSVAVATLLGGGVAVATAATGHLPFQDGTNGSGPLPTASAPDAPGGDASAAGTGGASVPESPSGPSGSSGVQDEPSAAGSPSAPATSARPPAGPESRKPHPGRQHGNDPAATREERLDGLCRSYAHKKPEQRKQALGKPGFAPLVDAAGGPEHVAAYCADRAAEGGGPGPHEPGHASAKPGIKASPAAPEKPQGPGS